MFLEELDLFGNQLTEIPKEIGMMESLSILNLFGNQLTKLPPEFANCLSIRSVDLRMNPINEGEKYKIKTYVNGAEVRFSSE